MRGDDRLLDYTPKARGQSHSRAMYRKMLKEKYGERWKEYFWSLKPRDVL